MQSDASKSTGPLAQRTKTCIPTLDPGLFVAVQLVPA